MEEIIIRLSDTPNNMYGKPLGLLDGMVKTVEYNKEVKLLLNAGAIEPVTKPITDAQVRATAPTMAKKTVNATKTTPKKKVASKRFF